MVPNKDQFLPSESRACAAPDLWEWGNNVLMPGLLGNNGPCQGDFSWSLLTAPVGSIASSLLAARTCVEGWPDGTGSFSTDGKTSTSYTAAEWAMLMDDIDWTEGITIRTIRVKSTVAGCEGRTFTSVCRPEVRLPQSSHDSLSFFIPAVAAIFRATPWLSHPLRPSPRSPWAARNGLKGP